MTDLFAVHDYARTGDLLFEKYKDLGKPGVPVPPGSRARIDSGLQLQRHAVSIFRNSAASPTSRRDSRYRRNRGDIRASRRRPTPRWSGCAGSTRAIAKLPFAGICYTQITDVEQEINGLMTYDRKLKFDSKALEEMNGMLR